MTGSLKGTMVAALAFFWLTASPAPAPAAACSSTRTDTRVPFSLTAIPPRPEPGPPLASPGPPLLLSDVRDGDREAGSAGPVPKPKKMELRAWVELGAFMTYSMTSYWTRAAFPEDWQFQLDFHVQMERFFGLKGWRFDSNNFKLNWTHALAGGIYFQFGRANHMSWLYSWMMCAAASTFWEGVVEWREVISLNDQMMTGLGGFATGEPWYQIGHYLGHQSGLVLRGLSFLNPVVKFNHWLDRKGPEAKRYDQPGWHDLSLFTGARRLASAGRGAETGAYFGLHTQLLGLQEYGKPGQVRRRVKDTYFSEISLDYAVRGGHADETRFFSKAVTWGLFRQKINDGLEGYSLTLGLGSAFEYFKKRPFADYDADPVPVKTGLERLHLEDPRNFTDKLAILDIAGPVLDWTVFRRGLKFRTVVEAYLNFALVNSYAINEYSRSHDIAGLKTTVFYYGYYYGFGGTFSASARLDWRSIRARAQASFSAWGSADSRDRFQAEVTNNAHLSDTRARYLLGVGWKVPKIPMEFFADLEGVQRTGRLAEISVHRLEKKAYAGLEFSY